MGEDLYMPVKSEFKILSRPDVDSKLVAVKHKGEFVVLNELVDMIKSDSDSLPESKKGEN